MKLGLGLGLSSGASSPPAYLSHILLYGGAGDWSDFGTTEGAPVITAEKVTFDGVDDALVADFTRDYSGCSVFCVVKVLSTNSAQDCVFQINPGTTSIISLAAKTSGSFLNQMRLPASGYGSTLVNSFNPSNGEANIVGVTTALGVMFETDNYVYCINGHEGAGKETRPAAVNMTRLVVGRNATGAYNHQEVYEIVVLDTTDVAVVESYLKDAKRRFGISIPYLTPLKRSRVAITGDSVAVGVGSATVSNRWSWLFADAFHADYTTLATADSQMSPLGFVSPADDAKIAATLPRVMTAGNLSGKSAVINFSGSNDWTVPVPLGVFGSTDEMEFYGAMHDGFQDFLTNAPAGINLYLCTTVNPNPTATNGLGLSFNDYDAAIRDFVTQTNHSRLKLIDMRTIGLTNPTDFADGVHPNDSGNGKMGAYAIAAMAAIYGIVR